MCVIVYKPAGCQMPGDDILRSCWAANPDGAGMMFPESGLVRIRKGFMRWDAFAGALGEVSTRRDLEALPVALHFRIATHGAVKPGCCHPFPVCSSASQMRATEQAAAVGFMHNGVLSGLPTSEAVSDSMSFAKRVLSPLDRLSGSLLCDADAQKVVGSSTQGSRFLLMDGTGDVRVFGRWTSEGGVMFSNDNWRMRTLMDEPLTQADQMALFDACEAFGGIAGDPALYNLGTSFTKS